MGAIHHQPYLPTPSILHGVETDFPSVLDPANWENEFDGGSEKTRKIIARTWFDDFNNEWSASRLPGENDNALLHALVAKYYRWIAKLRPYVENFWFSKDMFNGSFASLVRLTASRFNDNIPAIYIKIVHQLWFENPKEPYLLLADIFRLHQEGKLGNDGTSPTDSPFWGMLVPNLAWDAIQQMPEDVDKRDTYEGFAAWITISAALWMTKPLYQHTEPRALAWHALMWHTFNEDKIDVFDYHGHNLHEIISSRPTDSKLIALPPLINVAFAPMRPTANLSIDSPVTQPVTGPLTIYNAFRAWVSDMEKYISIAQTTEITAWELVEFYLQERHKTNSLKTVQIPEDLV